jgi:hypothetical protein
MNTKQVVQQAQVERIEKTEKIEKIGNMPEKKFRAGAVSATVWSNKGHSNKGEETEYQTISLERHYMDKQGQWQSTNSFRIGDIPKANIVLQKAYEFLILNEQDLFKGGN